MTWPCFVIESTDRVRRALRRYSRAEGGCPDNAGAYHNAQTPIEDGLAIHRPTSYSTDPEVWPRDDPRWPVACSCGYQFAAADPHQLWYELIYVTPDGRECTLRDAPVGALWRCPWMEDGNWVGPDRESWALMLPPGGLGDVWQIDGPSSSGGKWQRTGVAPHFTAAPSIMTPRYHGWLNGGVLSDDTDGRAYP